MKNLSHMCSVWTCSHPWREPGTNGWSADSGVLWQMAIMLHDTGLWAQVPYTTLMESVYDSLVSNMHTSQSPAGGHFVGLWQCSSCSSSHMDQIPVLLLGCFFISGPVHLYSCNGPSPSISFMFLRLCWETHQTSLLQRIQMYHPGGAGLSV